jgi:hypothetical protein
VMDSRQRTAAVGAGRGQRGVTPVHAALAATFGPQAAEATALSEGDTVGVDDRRCLVLVK